MKRCNYPHRDKEEESKDSKNLFIELYKLLKARPFCNECIYEAELYDAYCLRIVETLEMTEE